MNFVQRTKGGLHSLPSRLTGSISTALLREHAPYDIAMQLLVTVYLHDIWCRLF